MLAIPRARRVGARDRLQADATVGVEPTDAARAARSDLRARRMVMIGLSESGASRREREGKTETEQDGAGALGVWGVPTSGQADPAPRSTTAERRVGRASNPLHGATDPNFYV